MPTPSSLSGDPKQNFPFANVKHGRGSRTSSGWCLSSNKPIWTISCGRHIGWKSSPGFEVKIKDIWNHHPVFQELFSLQDLCGYWERHWRWIDESMSVEKLAGKSQVVERWRFEKTTHDIAPVKLIFWLVVSTHLKNISQIESFPQVGVKIKNMWNHHRVLDWMDK